MNGVLVVGRSGDLISREFVELLATVAPGTRRLALALACVKPWTTAHQEVPDCLARGLAFAIEESEDEDAEADQAQSTLESARELVDAYIQPIPLSLLQDLVSQGPVLRRIGLINSVCALWGEAESVPRCYKREFALAAADAHDDYLERRKWLTGRTDEDAK